jgi:hypothetical protein
MMITTADMDKTMKCCPLVVDLLWLAVLLRAISGATVLLGRVVQIEIVKVRRRKRSFTSFMYDRLPPF